MADPEKKPSRITKVAKRVSDFSAKVGQGIIDSKPILERLDGAAKGMMEGIAGNETPFTSPFEQLNSPYTQRRTEPKRKKKPRKKPKRIIIEFDE